MKKRLSRNKGFTLVECIIAVAVFGLMSLVVFMILTNASVRAARASDSEENLAQLIENVVGDETYKKFDAANAEDHNLTLLIDNNSSQYLSVSYNVISGYKNYVECPNTMSGGTPCGHQANFTEFMSSSATAMVPINDPLTFNVATNFFVCPSCNQQVSFTLRCPDCGTTDVYNKASSLSTSGYLFTFINTGSCGFECSVCGSTAVTAVDGSGNYIYEKVSVEGFNVSGMVANGIRYGEPVDWTTHDTAALCKFRKETSGLPDIAQDTGSNGIQASLSYERKANNHFAGTYTLGLTVVNLPSGISSSDSYFIEVVLPAGYTVTVSHPDVTLSTTSIGNKIYPTMLIKKVGLGSLTSNISFELMSRESGNSFEYEYNRPTGDSDSHQGLFRWFGFTSVSVPSSGGRTDEGQLIRGNASGLYIGN